MQDIGVIIIIWAILLLVFLASGMPIAFALGGLGFLSMYLWLGPHTGLTLAMVTWASLTSFVLTAIVLFTMMGALFTELGINEIIYRGVEPLICRLLPGGLLHVVIATGALIGACSGSLFTATVTGGTMALPVMEKRGYDRSITVGAICASGTLGILIPPSVVLIIYGAMTETSVGKLFLAGVVPGILCTLLFMGYIVVKVKLTPGIIPEVEKLPWKVCLRRSLGAWPLVIIILFVMGSIYAGVATPTEAAALGCVGIFLLGALHRRVTWDSLQRSAMTAARLMGMIIFLLIGGYLMTIAVRNIGISELLTRTASQIGTPLMVFLMITLVYLILGCVMDSLAMIVATLPIFTPIMAGLGFDLIWFGIVVVLYNMIGVLTPPVGVLLFTIKGLRPDYPFPLIVRGCVPFFVILLLLAAVLYVFPQLATWLPSIVFYSAIKT